MVIYNFDDFLIESSTYRPFKIDFTYERILQVFAENKSTSVYQVFKKLTETSPDLIQSGLDYKNVHVRIKRLVESKQIEQLKEHFERGAIHYKITTYGLISYLSQSTNPVNFNTFKVHKDNNLIRDLIYQFLEEKTIDSLDYMGHRPTVPADLISDYIRDCCRMVFDMYSLTFFEDVNLIDILPSDKVIQDYVTYLMGRPVTNKQSIIKEFKEYEMKFEKKVDDPDLMYLLSANEYYSKYYSKWHLAHFFNLYNRQQKLSDLEIKAPFPILNAYNDVLKLDQILSTKINTLGLQIILNVGELCNLDPYGDEKTWDELEKSLLPEGVISISTSGRGEQIEAILQDNKFKSIVDSIQGEYLIGLEAFRKGKTFGIEASKIDYTKILDELMSLKKAEMVKSSKLRKEVEDATKTLGETIAAGKQIIEEMEFDKMSKFEQGVKTSSSRKKKLT